jgi:hypothetical protein
MFLPVKACRSLTIYGIVVKSNKKPWSSLVSWNRYLLGVLFFFFFSFLCGAADQTQDLAHAGHVLYQWATLLAQVLLSLMQVENLPWQSLLPSIEVNDVLSAYAEKPSLWSRTWIPGWLRGREGQCWPVWILHKSCGFTSENGSALVSACYESELLSCGETE